MGAVLVVAGLSTGAYVAWQLWGTDVVAQRTHRALIDEAERAWGRPSEASEPAREGRDDLVVTDRGTVSAVVRIPRFGDDYEVPLLEGTAGPQLAAGFGRFPTGARPGDRGNFALAAHRVTHGEPLRDMPALEPGDEVVVETRRSTYTYVLDTGGSDLTVPFTAAWVLADEPRNPDGGVQPPTGVGDRLITLTTCSELFRTDGRLVAFGHLARVEPTGR
ncbi:class E sortase [Microvirga sp. 0TCS3.31]